MRKILYITKKIVKEAAENFQKKLDGTRKANIFLLHATCKQIGFQVDDSQDHWYYPKNSLVLH